MFYILLILLVNNYSNTSDFRSIHQCEYEKYINTAAFEDIIPLKVELSNKEESDGLTHNYYGYLPYWISTSTYSNFDYKLLTHIAYFSVEVNQDGSLGNIPNISRYNSIVATAHPRGIKIHMTFTLFGASSVSSFLNNTTAREEAIENIKNFVVSNNIEGANIDFEFVTSSVRDSFSDFIQELSYELWNLPSGRSESYIAIPTVPGWYPGFDYALLADNSDGLFIMGYGYHYTGSSQAGPVAPTYNSSFWGYYAINTSIGDFLDIYNVDPKKLILGMPYYGYDWPTVSSLLGSNTTGSGSAVIFTNAKAMASTHGRQWDTNSQTPWYYYQSGGWHQCWYEDSVSIYDKLTIARDSSLQGAGCWALGYDNGEDDLWNVIEDVFWKEPPTNHFIVEVNTTQLNVRAGPSSIYPILSTISLGERYTAFDYFDTWYKIYYPCKSGPYYGWIFGGDGFTNQFLEGVSGDSLLRVTANLINVRTGPTTDSAIITQLADGQSFVADSFSGNWARIYLPDTNHIGWFSYASYSNTIACPEDSNEYSVIIDSINYPDTAMSGDTFSITLYLKNTGWGPFDSSVCLKTDVQSNFYLPGLWLDSVSVQTGGFNGLPNQSFKRECLFIAPSIIDTQTIAETFVLTRKGVDFSTTIPISIVICGNSSAIELNPNKSIVNFSVENPLLNNFCLFHIDNIDNYSIEIYDISGRSVFQYSGYENNLKVGKNLNTGIYFFIFNSEYLSQFGKITKMIN